MEAIRDITDKVSRMRKIPLNQLFDTFRRKKGIDIPQEENQLKRCLSTLDLTALGIGSTLGVGVYVLAGEVSKDITGPSVTISFAIAAFASILAGLCYAEFGARVPKAGSAYIYSYVTVGEFIAFLIGWTLILEYMIGSASVVRGLSDYVDGLFNKSMSKFFTDKAALKIDHLSEYPDFFAFLITMLFSAALAFGAKESSTVNNIFTMVNLVVVLFVIIGGSFHANIDNWKTSPPCEPGNCPKGKGGFMPFGVSGVISGAAVCFYGFIGFDCVATAGEEAKNPKKSIPISIVGSLVVVFLAYFGVSTVLTLALPYYEQNKQTPLPHLFHEMGWDWARYLVSAGAICALCASLMGAMFPLPRVIYAMASDGLLFKWMGKVNPRFHTPFYGTFSAGLFTGILAAIFNLSDLVQMMSIGTLLAYSIVAASVLILRYEEGEAYEKRKEEFNLSMTQMIYQLFNKNKLTHSTKQTAQLVTSLVTFYFILSAVFTGIIHLFTKEIMALEVFVVVPLCIVSLILVLTLVCIHCQPTSEKKLYFSVPLVPYLPALSILINTHLMIVMDYKTWIRFIIWMVMGLAVYFFYGMWNSELRNKDITELQSNFSNGSAKKLGNGSAVYLKKYNRTNTMD